MVSTTAVGSIVGAGVGVEVGVDVGTEVGVGVWVGVSVGVGSAVGVTEIGAGVGAQALGNTNEAIATATRATGLRKLQNHVIQDR